MKTGKRKPFGSRAAGLFVAIILAAAVLAGCSSEKTPSSDKPQSSEATAEKTPAETPAVTETAAVQSAEDSAADALGTGGTEETQGEDQTAAQEIVHYDYDDKIPVTIEGYEIRFGEVTLQEAIDRLGLKIADADDLATVNKDDSDTVAIDLGKEEKYLYFGVENYGGENAKSVRECRINAITYSASGKDEYVSIGGITVGNTEEDAIAAFGTPADTYVSDREGSNYKVTGFSLGDYYIEVTMSEGELIDKISVFYEK